MSTSSLASKLLKSSIWTYLASWLDKLIGFISTLILARLLMPDDFGVVAATSIITGLFHIISSVGTDQYLIRKKIVNYEEYNTGWTINIIMKSISAVSIFLLADPIAEFMGDDRLILILQVVCISPLLAGFFNIGMFLYERDYNFKPKFILGLSSRILGFIIKITLALYLQNYWAFIFAEILENLLVVVGSFIIHPFRPKFSLIGWRQQWGFSQWILLKSIFVYFRFRVDSIFISKFFSLPQLGAYSVASDLAGLPAGQIVGPVMQPLYVGLSALNDKPELFADKVHKSIALLFIILLPISFGTYITAENLVYVLLGGKWQSAVPIVMILAFMLIPGSLGDFFTRVMTAMGNVKLIFKFELLLSLITISSFALLAAQMSLNEFALLRISVISFNTMIVLVVLTHLSKLSFFRITGLLLVPLLVSISMVFFIIDINQYIKDFVFLYQLALQVLAGALFYFVLVSAFVFLLRNRVNEYQFIWKTFYLRK